MNNRSFSKRLTRHIVAVLLVIMVLMTIAIMLLTVRGVGASMQDHYMDIVEQTNDRISGLLRTVEVSATNNADALEKNLQDPRAVRSTLESELKLNPDIVGCGMSFIPNYFPQEGRYFEAYARWEGDQVRVLQIGSDQHDYFSAEWFQTPLQSGQNYWSEPYYDEAGAKRMLCTYSIPIKDQTGETVGILGADISLDWLSEQLKKTDLRENSYNARKDADEDRNHYMYSFILGRKGEYLGHPDRSRILNKHFLDYVCQEDSLHYVQIGQEMLEGKSGREKTVIDGIKSYIYYAPLERTGWTMAIVVPVMLSYLPGLAIGFLIIVVLLVGLLIIFILCRHLIHKATRPLTYLAHSAREVAKGHFDTPLPEIKVKDEIGQLRDSFENMQLSLGQYIDRLTEATARQASLESELDIARKIQMSMIPKTFPPYPDRTDIDIYGTLTPAKAVGGDLYDFYIREEKLFFCIGDVSGKGVPASLVMAVISALSRTLSAQKESPEKMVMALNDSVSGRNESMMFVTFFTGVLDLHTGILRYCNAGHNAPVILGKDGPAFIKADSNVPLGIMPGWNYTMQETTLAPGDSLLLYTDGLTEAENADHALFGEDRMFKALQGKTGCAPREVSEGLLEAVHAFVADAEQSDDLTLMVFRYH